MADPQAAVQTIDLVKAFTATDGTAVAPMDGLPSPSRAVRWGILGCGKIANDFALALQISPFASIAAAGARGLERAQDFAKRFNIPRAYGSYAELVQDTEVDIIYVATVPEVHREHCELALAAGKHVLVEKPIAASIEDAEAIVAAAQRSGKLLVEGMWSRFFPAFELVRQAAGAGRFGALRHVRSNFAVDMEIDEGLDQAKWSSGAALNLGVYPCAACVSFLGEPLSVDAAGCADPHGFGSDGEAVAFLRYPGACATLEWSHLSGAWGETEILGTLGSCRLAPPSHCPTTATIIEVQPTGAVGSRTMEFPLPTVHGTVRFPRSEGFVYEIAAVQRCVAAGCRECPQVPQQDSLVTLRILKEATKQVFAQLPKTPAG